MDPNKPQDPTAVPGAPVSTSDTTGGMAPVAGTTDASALPTANDTPVVSGVTEGAGAPPAPVENVGAPDPLGSAPAVETPVVSAVPGVPSTDGTGSAQ